MKQVPVLLLLGAIATASPITPRDDLVYFLTFVYYFVFVLLAFMSDRLQMSCRTRQHVRRHVHVRLRRCDDPLGANDGRRS
jgi:hypothetical protein